MALVARARWNDIHERLVCKKLVGASGDLFKGNIPAGKPRKYRQDADSDLNRFLLNRIQNVIATRLLRHGNSESLRRQEAAIKLPINSAFVSIFFHIFPTSSFILSLKLDFT
jgi:hypothetical protein